MAIYGTSFTIASSMVIIMANIVDGANGVGINWGRQTSQKLLPSMVVDMCMGNGISKVKLFSTNDGVLAAFSGSKIEVITAVPNIQLKELNTYEKTNSWVRSFILFFRETMDVDIRYISVGIEPFSKIERVGEDTSFIELVAPVMKYMERSINEEPRLQGKVKPTVTCSTIILKPVTKPSHGDFRDVIKDQILEILYSLNRTDAPFMISIYPYASLWKVPLPLEFGLFDRMSNFTVIDGNLTYTNVFDFKYDTLVWALRRYGFGNLKIVVAHVGWPTDGGPNADAKTAKRFYDGLFKKIATNEGTPLLPGTELDVYLYSLSDENQRRLNRGPFERHYGIYYADGTPKFNLDFRLQGRDIKPESATGISYMPQRWCILDKEAAKKVNNDTVTKNYEFACKFCDCTTLENGSSCSHLDEYWMVSYAFNMFFQMNNQRVADQACDFDGLGMITETKPVLGDCEFPVQILSTLFLNGMSNAEMQATLGIQKTLAMESTAGQRLKLASELRVIVPLLWIVFLHFVLNARCLQIHRE